VEKLVRDRIPEIIAADGAPPLPLRRLEAGEKLEKLEEKLREEVGEYLESRAPEELADILEVIRALAEALGLPPEDLERIRLRKARERGAFELGIAMDFPE